MAKIARDEVLEQKLKEVNRLISEVADINAVLKSNTLQVSTIKTESAKSVTVTLTDKGNAEVFGKLTAALIRHKELLTKEIKKAAEKYRIELSDEDDAILS